MAKKAQTAAATETKAVEAQEPVAMTEVITGTLVLESVEVDEDGAAVDTKVLTIEKGKVADKARYQASHEGVKGAVSATIAAAINDLLVKGLKILPAAWAVPKNEKEVKFPEKGDNKPKEPESIDDLSEETAQDMRVQMRALDADFAEYKDAENRTREMVRKVAMRIRDMRVQYSKAEFGIFVRLADAKSDLAKFLTAKNTLGEFVFFANIPDELLQYMPEGKNGPKAAQAWVNGLRGNLAGAIVSAIKTSKELSAMGVSDAVREVTKAHFDGEEVIAFEGEQAAVECLWGLHEGNWPAGGLFDVNGSNQLTAARDDDGKHITASVFGSEGADELVKAIANAFNGYVSAGDKAVKDDMQARVKGLVAVARDFNTLSPDEVARHLFNILAGRIDEETEETLSGSVNDCLAVVDKLGGWLDAVAGGTMSVADVLAIGKTAPANEGDAEADADAEA